MLYYCCMYHVHDVYHTHTHTPINAYLKRYHCTLINSFFKRKQKKRKCMYNYVKYVEVKLKRKGGV